MSEWFQVPMSAKSVHSFPVEGVHRKRTLVTSFNYIWSFFVITSEDTEMVSAPLSCLILKYLGKMNE